jgi:hypothetical protein
VLSESKWTLDFDTAVFSLDTTVLADTIEKSNFLVEFVNLSVPDAV